MNILNVPKEGVEPSQAFATPDPKSGRYAKILVLRQKMCGYLEVSWLLVHSVNLLKLRITHATLL